MMFAGDQRDLYKAFHEVEHSSRFFWKEHPSGLSKHCHFNLHVYPSHDFYTFYNTRTPIASVGAIIVVFILTAILFSFYDQHNFKRQQHVITHATSLIIDNARRATINEREMNDFIAHEVRRILLRDAINAFVTHPDVLHRVQRSVIPWRRLCLPAALLLRRCRKKM